MPLLEGLPAGARFKVTIELLAKRLEGGKQVRRKRRGGPGGQLGAQLAEAVLKVAPQLEQRVRIAAIAPAR